MKKGVFIVFVLAGIMLLGVLSAVFLFPKQNKEENEGNNVGVIEFPALTLCRNTGGTWQSVSAEDYPLNEEEGVYNPTTNPEINYKCFCQAGKKWNVDEGCK